jgi:hypothetical protein
VANNRLTPGRNLLQVELEALANSWLRLYLRSSRDSRSRCLGRILNSLITDMIWPGESLGLSTHNSLGYIYTFYLPRVDGSVTMLT